MKLSILLASFLAVTGTASYCAPHCSSPCTSPKGIKRKEYGSMTHNERLAFINGVKCLARKPSLFGQGVVPASTSLWNDFTAVHVNMTTSIHISGIFLSWHRHFIYLLEKALHDKCGYPANLGVPYWDWTKYPSLESSPIFDGSATSLGGNGLFTNDDPYVVGVGQELPHGTGGGCVTTGPFVGSPIGNVAFGPFAFNLIFTGLPSTWNQPNVRCLYRDLNDYGIATYDNSSLVAEMLAAPNITQVQVLLNSKNVGTTSRGLHGGGHYGVGGAMFDFFASPGDPVFFLHHGNLDRLWDKWQAMEPATRRFQYNGTSTILNTNATPEVSNSTKIAFSVLGSDVTLKDVADPAAGPYCYCYV